MKNMMIAELVIIMILITQAQTQRSVFVNTHIDSNNKVYISFENIRKSAVDTITIYRSFIDIDKMYALDLGYYPITKIQIPGKIFTGIIIDSMTAHNTTYYYYVKVRFIDGETVPSKVIAVTIPDIVPVNSSPVLSLFIDKIYYFCEVRCGSSSLKRFPVNLGAKPWNRKTYYDCMSTPEGVYHVEYIRPVSSFHSALGVSYPNAADRLRYSRALKQKKIPTQNGKAVSIGGSIQIHGGGIGNNWTWGCIAMRNDDLDWIFFLPQLKKGVPVIIVGNEFTRDSLLRNDTM
jgi:hypothetical protein